MPPVIEVFNQLEELTRRTRSSRMPMTRGTSPVWGDMMSTMGGRRRGSVPGHVGRVVDGIRRRQDRVVSVPDQRQVEQTRNEERGRGGPPVPHNSLDLSVISLSDSVNVNEETIQWETVGEDTTPEGSVHQDDDDDSIFEDIQGVPPVDPNARAMLDAAIATRLRGTSLETTIDLTDSPVRSPSSSAPLFSQSPPSQSSPSSSLKCPVCLETFSAIRKRGSRLVSTVCGHVFCGRCLPACVRTSGQCPACRKRIGYQDFHPIYLY